MALDIAKRNWRIYFSWIEGKPFSELADEFNLPAATIKDIVHELIPAWAKHDIRLRENGYHAFRAWKRKQLIGAPPKTSAPRPPRRS